MNQLVEVLLAFLAGCAVGLSWLSLRRILRRRELAGAQKTAAGLLQQAEADIAQRLATADREARLRAEAAEAKIEEDPSRSCARSRSAAPTWSGARRICAAGWRSPISAWRTWRSAKRPPPRRKPKPTRRAPRPWRWCRARSAAGADRGLTAREARQELVQEIESRPGRNRPDDRAHAGRGARAGRRGRPRSPRWRCSGAAVAVRRDDGHRREAPVTRR